MATETEGQMAGALTMLSVNASITLDFTLKSDRNYPDLIPNYDEIRVASFEATSTIDRTAWSMDFIAFPGSPTGTSIDLDIYIDPQRTSPASRPTCQQPEEQHLLCRQISQITRRSRT